LIQTDDGIGVHVIDIMKKHPLPGHVELFDGGTLGYDLLQIIEGRKKVIVVDAVKGQQPPGTLYRFSPGDVPHQNHFDSLHQLGIIEAIRLAGLQDKAPEDTVIIGVEPEIIDWGLTPTDTVKMKIPRIMELVKEEIRAAGKPVSPTISKN